MNLHRSTGQAVPHPEGGGSRHCHHLLRPLHLLQCHPGVDPVLSGGRGPGPAPLDRLQQLMEHGPLLRCNAEHQLRKGTQRG